MDYNEVFNKIKTILNMDVKEEVVLEDTVEPIVEVEETVEDVKLATSILEDGSTIYFDGDFGVETIVYKDEEMITILEDGEYVLEDGSTFVYLEGIVSEFTPVEVEEVIVEEVVEELEEEVVEEVINYEDLYNEIKVVVEELTAKLNNFETQEIELKSEIEKLSQEPEVESITTKPTEVVEMTMLEKRLAGLDNLRKLKK